MGRGVDFRKQSASKIEVIIKLFCFTNFPQFEQLRKKKKLLNGPKQGFILSKNFVDSEFEIGETI